MSRHLSLSGFVQVVVWALLLLPSVSMAATVSCREAIVQAERDYNLPPRLLAAIARVESGRRNPATGQVDPYPWTINAEGRGSMFPSRSAGIAAVQELQAGGMRSIDVGCMQINLRHHPRAFASLEEAFDPLANARYAARFLRELMDAKQDWHRAAASYHSQNPQFGEPYLAKVLAAWEDEKRLPDAAPAMGLAQAAPPAGQGAVGGGFFLGAGEGTARGLAAYRAAPVPVAGASRRVVQAASVVAPPKGAPSAAAPQRVPRALPFFFLASSPAPAAN